MVQRARESALAGKRKEGLLPLASKEPTDESSSGTASVWTCPCRLVCGNEVGADAVPSMERRRKLQRSRMNSLTYR